MSRKHVNEILLIQLHHGAFNFNLRPILALASQDVRNGSVNQPMLVFCLILSEDRIGFARTRLSIGEDSPIVPFKQFVADLLAYLLEDSLLVCDTVEHLVEHEVVAVQLYSLSVDYIETVMLIGQFVGFNANIYLYLLLLCRSHQLSKMMWNRLGFLLARL